MLETLIADGDFPEDDDFSGCDPNADTVIMDSLTEEDPPITPPVGKRSEERILPGHIANRLLVRLGQGPYEPKAHNRVMGYRV